MINTGSAAGGAWKSRISQRVMMTAAIGLVTLVGLMGATHAAMVSVTCTGGGGNSNQETTYTVTNATLGQCFNGDNFDNTINSTTLMLGETGWTLSDLSDAPGGPGPVDFTVAPLADTLGGTWTLDGFHGYDFVALILKAGNSFAAFLLDTDFAPTGQWTTSRELSHAGIYTTGSPSPVPVPAAALLMVTALGGLGMLARRRRAA